VRDRRNRIAPIAEPPANSQESRGTMITRSKIDRLFIFGLVGLGLVFITAICIAPARNQIISQSADWEKSKIQTMLQALEKIAILAM